MFSVSSEGFQSWMWRGLTFLLPFLFFGHVSLPLFFLILHVHVIFGERCALTFTVHIKENMSFFSPTVLAAVQLGYPVSFGRT